MIPVAMVDLGAEARPAEVRWVVEACNQATAAQICRDLRGSAPSSAPPSSAGADEEPPTLVQVSRQGPGGLVVRIEVRRSGFEGAAVLSRELEFSESDPEAERWRSVGFALAILVGEAEQRQAESVEQESVESEEAQAEPLPDLEPVVFELPAIRSGLFLGGGAVVGEGAGSLRTGVGLRGGWLWESGWQLGIVAGTANVQIRADEAEARWTHLGLGGGYRLGHGKDWALSEELLVGTRRLSVDFVVDDRQDTGVVWSPILALNTVLWWQPLAQVGLWAGVSFSSPLAQTQVVDSRSDALLLSLPLVDTSGSIGLWWWM